MKLYISLFSCILVAFFSLFSQHNLSTGWVMLNVISNLGNRFPNLINFYSLKYNRPVKGKKLILNYVLEFCPQYIDRLWTVLSWAAVCLYPIRLLPGIQARIEWIRKIGIFCFFDYIGFYSNYHDYYINLVNHHDYLYIFILCPDFYFNCYSCTLKMRFWIRISLSKF